jgi:putative restriction endonuclease
MGFGVFIHRFDSIYQDSPAEHYQFPSQYLTRVEACVGDWVVYYEPSKIRDTRGYFGIAKVQRVIRDPSTSGMYRAIIEPGSYLEFANAVPFNDASGPVERGILNEEGRISGRAQAAVRLLSPQDFSRIVELGLRESAPLLPRLGNSASDYGLDDMPQTSFQHDQERDRTTFIISRIVRDRVFRRVVLRAYDQRCAVSGLKFINGGGRAEVDAAHIRSVEASGPDIINNGIALSGTAHWMFDRGLITLSDDLEILISRHVNDQDSVRAFIDPLGRALAPSRTSERPHPHFLQWHREHCFKQ